MISIEPATSPSSPFSLASPAILTPLLACLVIVAVTASPAHSAPSEPSSPAVPGETKASETKDAPPAVSVEEPVVDLGALVKGDRVEHTFVLRNPGTDPIRIDGVATYVELEVLSHDETIPPGGEARVRLALDTAKLTGPGASIARVFVNGIEEPAATLRLEFNVLSRLAANPGFARWIYVQHEQEGTIPQTVYSTDGADFEILRVEAPRPGIQVSFREPSEEELLADVEGSQWIVEATLESTAPVGPIEGVLRVDTTHPRQETLQIPVSGFVRPALFVSPQEGALGTIEGSRRVVYTVRNFATDPIELTGAKTDLPGVTARIEPIEEGRRYEIVVELESSEMETGPFSGTVTVATDSEKIPTLDIDLGGTVVEPVGAGDSSR